MRKLKNIQTCWIRKSLPDKKKGQVDGLRQYIARPSTLGQVGWQYIAGQYIAQCTRTFKQLSKIT